MRLKGNCFITLLFLAGAGFMLSSCSSTEELVVQGAGLTFHDGMQFFRDKDYVKARDQFDIVVKQYPASVYADSAQFYLAETYQEQEEYVSAAFEYENVYKNYPSSKLAPDARFMIAKCYAQQTPRVQLDQQGTSKAIEAFQTFIDYYPQSPSVPKAEQEILELRERLAEKYYEVAELYTTMGYYKAAIVYYDLVLEQYHDSDYADKAAIGKVKVLIKRRKDADAKAALEKFYNSFPNSGLKQEADQLARTLDVNVAKRSEVN